MGAENNVVVVISGDDETGPSVKSATNNLLEFQRRGEESMGSFRSETREAKAGMAALGEEIGIGIPRHLRSALAEFDVLRKAFSTVAFGLELGLGIEVFDKLMEKIPEIANEVMGWGKAEQDVYARALKDNQDRIKWLTDIRKLQRDIVLDQLSGSAKSAKLLEFAGEDKAELGKELTRKTEEWQKAAHAVDELRNKQQELNSIPSTGSQFGSIGQMSDYDTQIKKAAEHVDELRRELDQLQQASTKAGLLEKKETVDASKIALQSYEATVKSLKSVEDQISADGAEEWQKIVQRYGRRIQQIQDLAAKEPSLAKRAAQDIAQTEQQETDALRKYWDGVQLAMERALAPNDKILSDLLAIPSALVKGPFSDMVEKGARIKDILTEVEAETQKVKTAEENYDESVVQGDREINAIRQKARTQLQGMVDDYKALAIASGDPKLIQNAEEFEKKLEQIKVVMDSIRKDALQKLTSDTEGFFTSILDGSKSAGAAFADFGKSLLQTMDQIIAKMLAVWLIQEALGWVASAFGTSSGGKATVGDAGSTIPPIFGGDGIQAAAGGGMFGAGDFGWVGENGPELVRFGSAATVIPNSASMAMAGGGGDTYNIDARGAQAGVSQEILNAIRVSHEAAVKRAQIEFRETRRRRP